MPAILRIKKPAQLPVKFLRFGKRAPAVIVPGPGAISEKALSDLVGKAVFFASNGQRVAGKVARADGDNIVVRLAVPNREGMLIVSDSEFALKASDSEIVEALMQEKRVKRFEAGMEISVERDAKFSIVTEGKSELPVDFLNVKIEGHASTFGTPTDRDRGGDYVIPGAFDKTLAEFRQNPVILTDHHNEVKAVAGSWSKVSLDSKGLGVRGDITNAPGMRDLRHKLVENHVKGLSIGGIWYYLNDGFGIEEADLLEISIVAVPMNPKTLAHTASIGEAECRKAFAKFWRGNSSLRSE